MSAKRIGYIRICGKRKNEKKQLHAMELDITFTDTDQSISTEKTQLLAAFQSTNIGDQVFVESIDRLGSSKMDVLRNVTEFTRRGASVKFVKEGLIFTEQDEPMSILIKTLLFEFNPPNSLSISSVAAKKTKKVTKVAKVILTPKQIVELKRRASAGENKTALAKHFAISRESLLLYLR